MPQISFLQKLHYKFDNLMSKGPIAMISLLGILSLLVVVLAGAILWLFQISPEGEAPMNFTEGTWQSLMRTLDSGTMGGDTGWGFRIVAFLVTLGGVFIISTLIGILGSGIENKLDSLRKGKSFVIEQNHTLILGWSSKIFTIIGQLIIANENQKNGCIVILADIDKVEMEDEIRSRLGNFKNTKVICRKGDPNDLVDLAMVNPQDSKSIIVLAAESSHSDSLTIKTILAITNNPDRRTLPYHIVAEIREEKNMEVARVVGKEEVELVLTDDIIGRIMVQTSRQSGLSIVYTELMDFEGAEMYFSEEPTLIGKTFAECLTAYENSAVMGLQFSDGSVKVNPDMNYIVRQGDQIIAITEDDDTMIVSPHPPKSPEVGVITGPRSENMETERILLLGWNNRAMIIIREMDQYVAPGSYMKIVSAFENYKENILQMAATLNNLRLEFEHADAASGKVIDSLDITSYDSIQLLCYKDEMDMQDADAQTLISLLHIRRIMEQTGKDMKVVSEMLDLRNRDLAEVTKADDFIVSDKLISLLMSQVSEKKLLMRVFDDLFNAGGSEIYLKPMRDYIVSGSEVDFYTLVESAARQGQTAIGYRLNHLVHDNTKAYGVVVNPEKSKKQRFTDEDRLIVLSEN